MLKNVVEKCMSSTELSDEILINLLQAVAMQQEAALKSLYELTHRRLYGVALRVVTNPDWAQDVLQDTYLQIWKKADQFEASLSPPLAWMTLLTRSRALDVLRRNKVEPSVQIKNADESTISEIADESSTGLDILEASQQATALHQCLMQMDRQKREVMALAYFQDMSHSELAQTLKLPLGTIKTWVRRGLEQLRVCLSRFA
jgi:RNA polymerase sigma factor (sigma-70 family)